MTINLTVLHISLKSKGKMGEREPLLNECIYNPKKWMYFSSVNNLSKNNLPKFLCKNLGTLITQIKQVRTHRLSVKSPGSAL